MRASASACRRRNRALRATRLSTRGTCPADMPPDTGRQQFRFAIDAIRIDVFSRKSSSVGAVSAGWARIAECCRAEAAANARLRVAGAPGEDRERVPQRVDQASRRAHVGAGIAVRCVQLRVRHAVEIAPIQREVLACEAVRRAQSDRIRRRFHRAFCRPACGACCVASHLCFLFSELARDYQPASNLTRKIATSDKSNYQHLHVRPEWPYAPSVLRA